MKIGQNAFDLYDDLWNKERRAVPKWQNIENAYPAAGFEAKLEHTDVTKHPFYFR
ncbi:hypothetical protein ABZ313_40330 [Streptomyces sp. NPDC006251]|uniref:hypothetical protein n=1 Tax=Streptomyces sp. NPDC006251 TaxID=3155718 RepID=UPI0033A1037C